MNRRPRGSPRSSPPTLAAPWPLIGSGQSGSCRPGSVAVPAALLALVMAVAAVAAVAVGPSPASAQGCSALDRAGTRCNLADQLHPPRPTPGGKPVVTSSSPPAPRFVWVNLLLACDATGSRGWTPITDLAAAIRDVSFLATGAAPARPGVLWIGELVNPVTGGTNSGFMSCVGTGNPLPPQPAPLPTAAEIWGAALTFQPQVHLDPYVRGLTGLATYMWYEGPTNDTVAINLNGYAVTATIRAVEFRWDMGGDSRTVQRVYASTDPGSAAAPAATHTYAQPAHVVVEHQIYWTGTSVLTGPGLPAGGITVDLGQAVLATARAYDVIEVRTPLVSGTNGG